jgi:hypothetical protein
MRYRSSASARYWDVVIRRFMLRRVYRNTIHLRQVGRQRFGGLRARRRNWDYASLLGPNANKGYTNSRKRKSLSKRRAV